MSRASATTAGLLALLLASPAHARDMSGRLGIGAESTLGFNQIQTPASAATPDLRLPGLSAVYRVSEMFGIQVLLTADTATTDQGVFTETTSRFTLGSRGHVGLASSDAANLDAVFGLRLATGVQTVDGTQTMSSRAALLEAGLRPEVFLTDDLSVAGGIGVLVNPLHSEVVGFTADATVVNLFGAGGLASSLGLHWYF